MIVYIYAKKDYIYAINTVRKFFAGESYVEIQC
jgi:hypothetical protein